jgi:hypothetical protein
MKSVLAGVVGGVLAFAGSQFLCREATAINYRAIMTERLKASFAKADVVAPSEMRADTITVVDVGESSTDDGKVHGHLVVAFVTFKGKGVLGFPILSEYLLCEDHSVWSKTYGDPWKKTPMRW